MNFRQPFKSIIIILVGRSHCLDAVNTFKNVSLCLGRSFSQQCRLHTSEKLKDIFQSYSFYTRIWGEDMTFQMLSAIRKSLFASGPIFLMSAVCLSPYNWKEHRIPDDVLDSCVSEYQTVSELCTATVHCDKCHKRQVVDKKMNNVDYCMCKGNLGYTDKSRTYDSWEPFLERKNILVWRRNHHKHGHLYSYKVYGTYDDMSLNAFMEVQLNSSFRTQWDTTALQLQVVDSDPESNSDLLYWLVKFPHFFANRDYVFKRRFKVNKFKKEVVIFSEVVDHSQIPEKQGIHRVKEYWSIMVLKANENFNKPGMSYTLTYFDNPGTSLPAAVTNFVASTAFPDFLTKVYEAAMSLQRRWENGEDVYVTLPPSLRYLRKPEKYISEVGIETIPSKEIAKLQDYSAFTGDSSFAYNEKKIESEINEKFSLRFKKVVIDLLEAIEVVSPEYEEKTILTQKIEQLVDKLGITNSRKHKLVKKLQALSVRSKLFVERAAEKKQESFKIMNEFERKHYYDNLASDEPNILHFVGLLLAINEILKVDKDMRTGKDLAKIEKKLENECLSKNSESNLTSAKHNSYNDQNFCECCEQYVNFSDKIGWYKYILSLLTSNPTGRNCVCSHKVISSDISNDLKPNGDSMNGVEKEYKRSEEISSWFYLSWVFGNKTENIESTENENEEHVSWQFWTSIYNFMFRVNV